MTIRRRHALVRRGVLLLPLVSLLVLPPRASMGAQPPAGAAQAPPPLPVTPKVPTSHAGLFAARDARAVAAIGYLRCFQGAVTALRTGALGQVPTGWSIACLQQGREWRAVFGELTEEAPGFAVRRQLALRGDGAVVTDPVDTARAGGVARALLRGLSAPVPGRGVAEFVPLVLHQGTYTEVWFLSPPADPARVAVGGDSLIQMNKEGLRELGHSKRTPPVRLVSVPTTGERWTLGSAEVTLPLLSELMVAHMAADLIPEVTVRTQRYESTWSRRTGRWTHRRR
jgi:hypothetical protein